MKWYRVRFLKKHKFDYVEKIVTECSLGWFGPYCESRCSKNCEIPGRCDWITGQCEGGCQDGWENPACDKSKDEIKWMNEWMTNSMWKSKLYTRVPARIVINLFCDENIYIFWFKKQQAMHLLFKAAIDMVT